MDLNDFTYDPDEFGYVDTETTGLDPRLHWAYELAWAIGDGDIHVTSLPHSLEFAERTALEIGRYDERGPWRTDSSLSELNQQARRELRGKILVGCNVAFDQEFLRKAFGYQGWHYRLLDIEAWGAGVLGYPKPLGNKDLQAALRARGFEIAKSDHTAYQDVVVLRQCHRALLEILASRRRQPIRGR